MGQSDDRHAQPRGDEQDVEVHLASIIVETVEASVGSAGRRKTVHGSSACQSKGAEEDEFEHSTELVDLQHRGAARRDDLCLVHASHEGNSGQSKCNREEHGSKESRQTWVAVKLASLTAKQPRHTNLRQWDSELRIAHVGDDHQGEQADHEDKFRGKSEDKAFGKEFNLLHIRHLLSRLESRAFQRTPRSSRSSCRGQSTA